MNHEYNHIISLENLYLAWQEFVRGKKNKKDVTGFAFNLVDNIYELHLDLENKTYIHGPYQAFNICDPKPRNIHKAAVRDRLLHHAIYRILYLHFDQQFIYDSYSCRIGKGTHRAIRRFFKFTRKVSRNNSRTCWILKCDIRKFFASIDHEILIDILKSKETDQDIIWLLERVICSFSSGLSGKGLPLGNLTSQLLVNVYMNELDQFIKHNLKVKYYLRYADDFVIMSVDKQYLGRILCEIDNFLRDKLKLSLHPNKIFIKTLASGIDFLGWVHFSNHRVLRTTTKRRILRKLASLEKDQLVLASYQGLLKHGNAYKLSQEINNYMVVDVSSA